MLLINLVLGYIAWRQLHTEWTDEFAKLGDRKSDPPLPLPKLSRAKEVVIVRHGQSTWNADGLIQGSSDAAKLTAKGISQAEASRDMASVLLLQQIMAIWIVSKSGS